jgi:hypothetical protein
MAIFLHVFEQLFCIVSSACHDVEAPLSCCLLDIHALETSF